MHTYTFTLNDRKALLLDKTAQQFYQRALYSNNRALSFAKVPCILTAEPKERCILTKEPCILTKEPCILTTEPKEPCVLTKESCTLIREPYRSQRGSKFDQKKSVIDRESLQSEQRASFVPGESYMFGQKSPIFHKKALYSDSRPKRALYSDTRALHPDNRAKRALYSHKRALYSDNRAKRALYPDKRALYSENRAKRALYPDKRALYSEKNRALFSSTEAQRLTKKNLLSTEKFCNLSKELVFTQTSTVCSDKRALYPNRCGDLRE